MSRRWAGIPLATALLALAGTAGSQSAPVPASPEAAFDYLHGVATHPRCVNCHGAPRAGLRTPTIGEAAVASHPMYVTERHNPAHSSLGITCTSCHGNENTRESGGPPGAGTPEAKWRMPAHQSMDLERGMSKRALCRQWQAGVRESFREARNCAGQPCTLPEFFVHHLGHDPLIAWAFQPGGDRARAPGDLDQLVKHARVWAPMLENAAWCDALTEGGPR